MLHLFLLYICSVYVYRVHMYSYHSAHRENMIIGSQTKNKLGWSIVKKCVDGGPLSTSVHA